MIVSASSSRPTRFVNRMPYGSVFSRLAVADAEDRAPAAQVVERDEGLRERRRMATERLGHAGPDAHATEAGGHHAHHDERVEERVGRRHELRGRGERRSPDRARDEAQIVVGQEQRVDPEEMHEPHRRPLEPERSGAVRLDADGERVPHGDARPF
jgi:hypothetical protein